MIDDDEEIYFPLEWEYPDETDILLFEHQEFTEKELKRSFGITSDMLGSSGPKLFEEE